MLRDTPWCSTTCVLGWDVQGIWPAAAMGCHINAVAKSPQAGGVNDTGDPTQAGVLVTADDHDRAKRQHARAQSHRQQANHANPATQPTRHADVGKPTNSRGQLMTQRRKKEHKRAARAKAGRRKEGTNQPAELAET